MSEQPPPTTAADLRAAAAAAKPRPRGAVTVPEWGGTIFVGVKTGDWRALFDRETIRRRKKDPERIRIRERLVIDTAEDQAGAPVFTAADENMLAAAAIGPVDRVFKLSAKLNGFLDDEDDVGN